MGSNPDLATEICENIGIPLSPMETSRFSNDNLFVQIKESVREKDVFVVQSLSTPVSDHLMELMITLDALRSASAKRITAVIPYYSYARSDKKDAPEYPLPLAWLPMLKTAGADRVLTMDLHADAVHGFSAFPWIICCSHTHNLCDYLTLLDLSKVVVVATDMTLMLKRTDGFAKRLGHLRHHRDKRSDSAD